MTWLAPIPLFPEAGVEGSADWLTSLPVHPMTLMPNAATQRMASASAAPIWRWTATSPVLAMTEATAAIEPARLRIPADLVRRMSFEARLAGKSESEVWAEAARAWLARHERDDDLPPTPPAAAQPCPRRERPAWVAIDALLLDLRARPCAPAAA